MKLQRSQVNLEWGSWDCWLLEVLFIRDRRILERETACPIFPVDLLIFEPDQNFLEPQTLFLSLSLSGLALKRFLSLLSLSLSGSGSTVLLVVHNALQFSFAPASVSCSSLHFWGKTTITSPMVYFSLRRVPISLMKLRKPPAIWYSSIFGALEFFFF